MSSNAGRSSGSSGLAKGEEVSRRYLGGVSGVLRGVSEESQRCLGGV